MLRKNYIVIEGLTTADGVSFKMGDMLTLIEQVCAESALGIRKFCGWNGWNNTDDKSEFEFKINNMWFDRYFREVFDDDHVAQAMQLIEELEIKLNNKMNNDISEGRGWVCPKCGRVNAPWVDHCPCGDDRKDVDYTKVAEDLLHTIEKGLTEPWKKLNERWNDGPYDINAVPPACRNCSNHPMNGGSGICHCILGTQITY